MLAARSPSTGNGNGSPTERRRAPVVSMFCFSASGNPGLRSGRSLSEVARAQGKQLTLDEG